jgi:hypothetical protein
LVGWRSEARRLHAQLDALDIAMGHRDAYVVFVFSGGRLQPAVDFSPPGARFAWFAGLRAAIRGIQSASQVGAGFISVRWALPCLEIDLLSKTREFLRLRVLRAFNGVAQEIRRVSQRPAEKPACRQDFLPHERANPGWRADVGRGSLATCTMKPRLKWRGLPITPASVDTHVAVLALVGMLQSAPQLRHWVKAA